MFRVRIAGVWAAGVLACGGLAAQEKPDPKAKPAGGWEARLTDGKLQKLTVSEETIPLETAFGTLKIPAAEVRRIEFGVRYTAAERKRIAEAIGEVLAADTKTRERGKDALLEIGAKAYPLVAREAKTARTNPHLLTVMDKLKAAVPEHDGELRDYDVVLTADESKLAGKLPESIRVKVGEEEKPLRWSDARVLANGSSAALEEKIEIVTINQFGVHGLLQTHFDKVVGVQVTGQIAGTVWGSGPYTSDSNLATAAVHSGVLKVGETAVIKIRVKGDPGGYVGSTQNGVASNNYGPWQGCYEILGKVKKN